MEGNHFLRIGADAALDTISGIARRDREFRLFSITECKQMRGIPFEVETGIGVCGMLADALAIAIWIIREGSARKAILRAESQNVSFWIRKSKAKEGNPTASSSY